MENSENYVEFNCSQKKIYILMSIVFIFTFVFCGLCKYQDDINTQKTKKNTVEYSTRAIFVNKAPYKWMPDEVTYTRIAYPKNK